MSRLTPEQVADKHARRLKGSLEDMATGVDNVTEAPTLKAAAKVEKFRAGINRAIENGKWQAGLKRVSLDQWKHAMKTKGINRVSQGIDEAKDKVVAFYAELQPFQDAIKTKLDKMPDITLEDSIARATFQMREMAKFRRKA